MSVTSSTGGGLRKLDNLVTFGDSWTDSGRIDSFIKAQGIPPPRYFDPIRQQYPSVLDYQVPAYMSDPASTTLYDKRSPDNTLYTIWVGTNDLGEHGMLTDGNAAGTTLTDFVEGNWTVFDRIYATGGRHFVLFNLAPLELAPLYKASFISLAKTASDPVQMEKKIRQYTSSVNTMFDYGLPFQLLVRKRWPGSTMAIFDTNTLLRNVFVQPGRYLEAPADAEGIYNVWDPVT